mgnify:CR=1 FL=1
MNILSPRTRGNGTNYVRPRKLDQNPNQRGGNRTKRNPRTIQIDSYQGKDRGFILRFLNQGTSDRESRIGNRGSITARHFFADSSQKAMEKAAEQLDALIEDLIKKEIG